MKQHKTTKSKFGIPSVKEIPSVKKSRIPIQRDEIERLRERSNEKLLFSFRFFDRSPKEFNIGQTSKVCDGWFITLIDILKDVSNLTRNQLVVEQRQHYDAHNHDWDKLSLRYPFDNEFLEQVECLQFRISQGRGRVHGFITGNLFYIVWLDPHHNLYPSDKHGGVKWFDAPQTCYERILDENLILKEQIGRLERENEELLTELVNK